MTAAQLSIPVGARGTGPWDLRVHDVAMAAAAGDRAHVNELLGAIGVDTPALALRLRQPARAVLDADTPSARAAALCAFIPAAIRSSTPDRCLGGRAVPDTGDAAVRAALADLTSTPLVDDPVVAQMIGGTHTDVIARCVTLTVALADTMAQSSHG